MLVGAEKKIMGWRNDILGPGKKRWLTPAMSKFTKKCGKIRKKNCVSLFSALMDVHFFLKLIIAVSLILLPDSFETPSVGLLIFNMNLGAEAIPYFLLLDEEGATKNVLLSI